MKGRESLNRVEIREQSHVSVAVILGSPTWNRLLQYYPYDVSDPKQLLSFSNHTSDLTHEEVEWSLDERRRPLGRDELACNLYRQVDLILGRLKDDMAVSVWGKFFVETQLRVRTRAGANRASGGVFIEAQIQINERTQTNR